MVAEHYTIEEYVEILSAFDAADQLRLIAALSERLAEKAAPAEVKVYGEVGDEAGVVDEPVAKVVEETDLSAYEHTWKPDPDWNPEAELERLRTEHRAKYGEVGDKWKKLAGCWKGTMPDDIAETLHAERLPWREAPNLDPE